MMRQFLGEEPSVLFRNLEGIIAGWVGILVALHVLSGVYQVQANEQAVVRRFGAYERTVNPGIHYRIPWPVDRVDKIKIMEVKRVEVGFWHTEDLGHAELLPYAITGDKNILHDQYVIQYRIADPKKFLFNAQDPEGLFRELANQAIVKVMASREVDPVLTTAKREVELAIEQELRRTLEEADLGISISMIDTVLVDPPRAVKDAFDDVTNARENKSTTIHEADNYRNEVIPDAKAQAKNLLEQAEAYRVRRTDEASGESGSFLRLLAEYGTARQVTEDRMFLEMVDELLPKVTVVVTATDEKGKPVNIKLIQGMLSTAPHLPPELR